MFWRRKRDSVRLAKLLEDFEELRVEFRALVRDVDDIDQALRRLRGRKVKTEALDEATPEPPPNGALPSIAQLRARGALPWR